MIESLGMIQKSASSVQRTIRVAVALTAGKGCQKLSAITDATQCSQNPNQFWNASTSQCFTKPTDQMSCQQCGGQAANNVCTILNYSDSAPPMTFPITGAGTTSTVGPGATPATPPGGAGAPRAGATTSQTFSPKVFYWGES